MRAGSLDACFAKRQRAGSQLQQLTREVGWFLERRPYRVFLDADPKAHAGIWRVQFYEKPDPAWSLLISELLFNLRCSLDYLVCELTIQAGNTVTNSTAFPIYSEPRFTSEKKRRMGGIWHTHQQTIASMQPDSANHVHAKSMGLLSDLSNGDKHKRLHLVGARVSTARTTRTDKGTVTGEPVITVSYEPLEDGDELQRVDMSGLSFGPESHTGFAAEFAFDVAFGKGGPAAGRPVIDTLTGIQSAVDSVLEYFAPWFDPSHDKWAMP